LWIYQFGLILSVRKSRPPSSNSNAIRDKSLRRCNGDYEVRGKDVLVIERQGLMQFLPKRNKGYWVSTNASCRKRILLSHQTGTWKTTPRTTRRPKNDKGRKIQGDHGRVQSSSEVNRHQSTGWRGFDMLSRKKRDTWKRKKRRRRGGKGVCTLAL